MAVAGGSRWRAFAGADVKAFAQAVEEASIEREYRYSLAEVPASFMLGTGQPGKEVRVGEPVAFTVKMLHASGDPILRMIHGVLSSGETLRGLCHVEIAPVSDDTRVEIGNLFDAVVEKLDKPPWEVGHHLRFRSSPVLRLVNNRRWRMWA